MAFEVLRTVGVARTVEHLNKPERRAYHAAVDALRGGGCSAGGKRLMALDGTDVALCQRNLYGAWRMITAYRADTSIVIVAVARHTRNENAVRVLAEVFPGSRRPAAGALSSRRAAPRRPNLQS